ncbi:TPA: hypothetical protein N0F65_000907 [Lagenidium giganteum]|uniref:glucan endo-1,3-beta-D-glucosidase n=1 Tax=Lagenidium giganteum TaxID=4803 RepID=A0AAV2YM09_9STRA|nr:TPA: hypothetical protein N0F65_000907 [Lagenidium giganteum]
MFWRLIAFGAALASSIVAANTGNVAVCYAPDHLEEYQDGAGDVNVNELQSAIDRDFKTMSQNFTRVRTYNSLYAGASPVKAAAAAGVKLYLGVSLRSQRSEAEEEVAAAVQAVKDYPGTVEAIVVSDGYLRSDEVTVLDLVNDIKKKLGAFARNVKFGTSQTVGTYLDDEDTTAQLVQELDFLGVSIMPYKTQSDGAITELDPANPMFRVQRQWDEMKAKFPSAKLQLTKTGFPEDPSVTELIAYYDALKAWKPAGSESVMKFWYLAFDYRPDHWRASKAPSGFYTYDGKAKVPGDGSPVAISEPELRAPSVVDQCTSGVFALRASTGKYLTRCNYESCARGSDLNGVGVSAETYDLKQSRWRILRFDNGKIAIQSDIRQCMGVSDTWHTGRDIVYATYRVPKATPSAQWEVERLANGKYAFRAYNGEYMAPCLNCREEGEKDVLYVKAKSSAEEIAQFEVTCV